MNPLSRLASIAGIALFAWFAAGATLAAPLSEEAQSLDTLYQQAIAEGGELVVYAGGDLPGSEAYTEQAFRARFPGVRLRMVVDYSKFHDVRLDWQLAAGQLVPDVIQFQTLQNFPRWKQEGRLLAYKPAGFSKVHDSFRDSEGAWVAYAVVAFSFTVDQRALGQGGPSTPASLADPRWRGRIASSLPQDDDAVLYLYKLYAEAYGQEWLLRLAQNQPRFARGSHTPNVALQEGTHAIGLATVGTLTSPASSQARFVIADGHPFMAWAHRAAIVRGAKNLAAAKLYLNWQLSPERQAQAFNGWSVRTDIKPQGGLAPIWHYPNANLDGFAAFMSDRTLVERWRQTMVLIFGEPSGPPSTGWLGLSPGR